MTTDAAWIQEAVERVNGGEREVVLDLSAVRRIDAKGLREMEELAGLGEEKSAVLVLSGVNAEIYRVLKQLKLAERFSYVTR